MTFSRVCWRSWRRQRCQPTSSPPRASRSHCSRYAVANANSSTVNTTCTRTARSFFWGGWPSSHCCFAALIQQFSMRLRSLSSSQEALIKDDLGQARGARQIHPRLRDQRPGPERLVLLDLSYFDRQRNLGHGIDQEEHFPAVDRDLDCLHFPPFILEAHLAGDLATPRVALRRVQIRAIRNAGDLLAKDPSLG